MMDLTRSWRVSMITLLALVASPACGGGDGQGEALVVEEEADAGGEDARGDAMDGGPADRIDPDSDTAEGGDDVSRMGPKHEVVIQGLNFDESTWTIEASGGVELAEPDEQGDATPGEGRATGVVREPLEKDLVYAWGEVETLEVDGTARVTLDGEIRRNGPKAIEMDPPGEEPPIRMTVRMSRTLLERNGRVGERMVAKYAGRAFEEAGYGFEIVYNLLPQLPPDQKSNCSAGEAPQWWGEQVRNGEAEFLGKDANLLMLGAGGGGCGAVGGKWGTTPGDNIDEERPWKEIAVGDNDWQRNMHGTLHEIGHQLGARHDHNTFKDGAQHWGYGYVEETEEGKIWWHRTPNVAGNGAPNRCGTSIDKRRRDVEEGVKRHQVYNECAIDRFQVVPE